MDRNIQQQKKQHTDRNYAYKHQNRDYKRQDSQQRKNPESKKKSENYDEDYQEYQEYLEYRKIKQQKTDRMSKSIAYTNKDSQNKIPYQGYLDLRDTTERISRLEDQIKETKQNQKLKLNSEDTFNLKLQEKDYINKIRGLESTYKDNKLSSKYQAEELYQLQKQYENIKEQAYEKSNRYESALREKSDKQKRLMDENTKLRDKLESMQDKFEEAKYKDGGDLKYKQKYDRAKIRLDELFSKLKSQEEEISDDRREVKKLKVLIAEYEEQRVKAMNESKWASNDKTKLQEKNEKQKKKLAVKIDKIDQLTNKLDEKDEQLKSKNLGESDEIMTLKKQMASQDQEFIKKLKSEKEKNMELNEALKQKDLEIKSQSGNDKKTVKDLKMKLSQIETELERKKISESELMQEMSLKFNEKDLEFKKKLEAEREHVKRVNLKSAELEERVTEQEIELETLRSLEQLFEQEKDKRHKEKANIMELEAENKTQKLVNRGIDENKIGIKNLMIDKENHAIKVRDLEQENNAYKKDIDKLTMELKLINETNFHTKRDYEAESRKLKIEKDDIQNCYKEAEHNNMNSERENQKLREKVKSKDEQVWKLTKEIELKDLTINQAQHNEDSGQIHDLTAIIKNLTNENQKLIRDHELEKLQAIQKIQDEAKISKTAEMTNHMALTVLKKELAENRETVKNLNDINQSIKIKMDEQIAEIGNFQMMERKYILKLKAYKQKLSHYNDGGVNSTSEMSPMPSIMKMPSQFDLGKNVRQVNGNSQGSRKDISPSYRKIPSGSQSNSNGRDEKRHSHRVSNDKVSSFASSNKVAIKKDNERKSQDQKSSRTDQVKKSKDRDLRHVDLGKTGPKSSRDDSKIRDSKGNMTSTKNVIKNLGGLLNPVKEEKRHESSLEKSNSKDYTHMYSFGGNRY